MRMSYHVTDERDDRAVCDAFGRYWVECFPYLNPKSEEAFKTVHRSLFETNQGIYLECLAVPQRLLQACAWNTMEQAKAPTFDVCEPSVRPAQTGACDSAPDSERE